MKPTIYYVRTERYTPYHVQFLGGFLFLLFLAILYVSFCN